MFIVSLATGAWVGYVIYSMSGLLIKCKLDEEDSFTCGGGEERVVGLSVTRQTRIFLNLIHYHDVYDIHFVLDFLFPVKEL